MNFKHGDAKTGNVQRLHKIWRKMLSRCNPNLKTINQNYAGRGITVCAGWTIYTEFKAWAESHGYADTLTIERRDNDGSYCPENCLWVESARQAKNRRTSHFLEHAGRRQIIADWSLETGIAQTLICHRLRLGWSVERTLTQPVR